MNELAALYIACTIAGFTFGVLCERWSVLSSVRRWLYPPKCEICGGKPYAVHGRARIGDDGEMGEPQFVLLCEACHVENEAAIRQELEERE